MTRRFRCGWKLKGVRSVLLHAHSNILSLNAISKLHLFATGHTQAQSRKRARLLGQTPQARCGPPAHPALTSHSAAAPQLGQLLCKL